MDFLGIDRQITLAINGWHSDFGDQFFFIYTNMYVWIPLAVVIFGVAWKQMGWKKALFMLLGTVLCLFLADQACNFIKDWVCRLRPTHEPSLEGMVHTVRGYYGGKYGFCSAHAANAMAVVMFTALIVRKWGYALMMSVWAVVSMWSRIYLGVHYFGDIFCGALLGMLIGGVIYYGMKGLFKGGKMNARGVMILCITYLVIVMTVAAICVIKI